MNKLSWCKFILIATDFIMLFSSLFWAYEFLYIVPGGYFYFPLEEFSHYILIHFFVSLIGVAWFWVLLRHYTYRKPFWFELKEVLRTLMILFVIELAIVAFSRLYVSRYFWSVTWICIFILVPLGRILMKELLIKTGFFLRDTVIIGSGKNAKEVFNALKNEHYLGLKVKLFVTTEASGLEFIEGVPVMRHNPELLLKLAPPENTQFLLAIDEENKCRQQFWLRYLMRKNCRSISIIPDFRGIPLYGTDMSFIFSQEMMLFRINNNLAKRSSRLIKRITDIVISSILLILLSPAFLLLYFLIKADGGSAIYKHSRIGQHKKRFNCLKFRTMVVNSQEVLGDLLQKDPKAKEEWDKEFKLKNDPRITRLGKFMRRTSIDELPQLWNVLKGEMSLVGPRPIIAQELSQYGEDVDYYLMAKPGMTGLWQVSGRNDASYEKRVYFDAWYAKNWSLWNDFVILMKTIKVVLKEDGAY